MYLSYQVWEALEQMVFLTGLVEKDLKKLVEVVPELMNEHGSVDSSRTPFWFRLDVKFAPLFVGSGGLGKANEDSL